MDFLDQLKEKKILSQKDIDNFKNYIDKKHGALAEEKKHAILKNAITYVVNRDLAELKIDNEEFFVSFFVEKTLLEDKEDLCAGKVFEKVISQAEPSDSLLQSLTKWVNDKINTPLEREILEGYYHHNHLPHKDLTLGSTAALPYPSFLPKKAPVRLLWGVVIIIGFYSIFSLQATPRLSDPVAVLEEEISVIAVPAYVLQKYHMPNRNFPHYLYYRDINEENLKNYLSSRSSLLKNEPYFTQLLATAKKFDLNPLLLFAIAGHEQAFVPEDHTHSNVMINNPFNVFGSWQRYNTSLKESSEIAARTILNSLGDLPPLIDPFFWMNRRYAEDPYWWKGVRAIFWHLSQLNHTTL